MADWPADGVTNWNAKMKANIDVGHDSDGTHKKSQMLTDMGWSPTSYTGVESITFPNGLIIKQGYINPIGVNENKLVTFAVAFPTACTNAFTCNASDVAGGSRAQVMNAHTLTAANMRVFSYGGTASKARWFAIGY